MSKRFLYYFNMRALFMGIGLSRLLTYSKEYVLLSFLLGTIMGTIYLYFVRKNNNKFINILLSIFIMIISLVILINMISTMYLVKMNRIFILIPFILLVIYTLSKNEDVITRISYILIVINILLYLLSLISLIKYFNISNFYYTNNKFINIIKSSLIYFIFSTSGVLTIREDKNIVKTYLVSSVTMLLIALLTYGILGSNLSSVLRYPEYIILKKISISSTITNIENIVSFMWLIDLFMIYLSNANSIKKISNKYILYLSIAISVVSTIIINTYYPYLLFIYYYSPFILSAFLFIYFFINKKTQES